MKLFSIIMLGLILPVKHVLHASQTPMPLASNTLYNTLPIDENIESDDDDQNEEQPDDHHPIPLDQLTLEDVDGKAIIRSITVEGNTHIPTFPILDTIPFKSGEVFLSQRTNKLIHNVYDLGFFKDVRVYISIASAQEVDLIVVVEEKYLLEGVTFNGNKHLSLKEIEKKVDFSRVPAIDEQDFPQYIKILEKLYREKDYHNVFIQPHLEGNERTKRLVFDIKEGEQTLVKRVEFCGNNYFRSKQLRSILFTREDWIGGFMDRAGSYQPEAIEADKYVIENYYQSNGFFHARVTDVAVEMDPETKGALVTFSIDEGEQYTIGSIHTPGNELLTEEQICALLPLRVGALYSRERVRESMEFLRKLWGGYGYVNADIEPTVIPDEINKTIAITFKSDLGNIVEVNRINIIGNNKTHDHVIRRQLKVDEGATLTMQALDDSKARVESLGYFDPRDGVNWRINRIGNDKVDLDLIVKEVKTGRFEFQMGFGGSPRDVSSPAQSFNATVTLSETNLFGLGLAVNTTASYTKQERNLILSFTNPWLFDRPIHANGDVYLKRSNYDDFKMIEQSEINENITGGLVGLGALCATLNDTTIAARIGADGITYKETPRVKTTIPEEERLQLQAVFDRRFISGAFLWTGVTGFKDVRNHPVHPSRGYQWAATFKVSLHSTLKDNPKDSPAEVAEMQLNGLRFGYAKCDFDGSWYTPLIGERDLVLCLHGHAGIVASMHNRSIPFRELYNIGGPASVRGFLFGDIGPVFYVPQLQQRDILGAKNAFWFNTELIMPVTADFSIKAAMFYDGGAGWNTPDADLIAPENLKNNHFSFRHSIGFGLRILKPTPVKIDWGFKLDRRKGESPSEVHFSMYHEF